MSTSDQTPAEALAAGVAQGLEAGTIDAQNELATVAVERPDKVKVGSSTVAIATFEAIRNMDRQPWEFTDEGDEGPQPGEDPTPAEVELWTPDMVPVHIALMRAARDILPVAKTREADTGGSDGKYKFRGIDDVMNATHPAFATHGVLVIPTDLDIAWAEVERGQYRNIWRHYMVKLRFEFIGPQGDRLTVEPYHGEALDNQDKGLGKARSYALKDLLSRMLTLPTHDPAQDNEHANIPDPSSQTVTADDAARQVGFTDDADRVSRHNAARNWVREHISSEGREPLRSMFDGRWPLGYGELLEWVRTAQDIADREAAAAGKPAPGTAEGVPPADESPFDEPAEPPADAEDLYDGPAEGSAEVAQSEGDPPPVEPPAAPQPAQAAPPEPAAPPEAPAPLAYTDEQIAAMDKPALVTALSDAKLSTAGSQADMRRRLREASAPATPE